MKKSILFILVLIISQFNFSQSTFNTRNYSKELIKIFNAHGTYNRWQEMKQLSFILDKNDGNKESHSIDLKSRKLLINSNSYSIGYDGQQVWMNSEGKFPTNKLRFYHSLFFYFYSMPFVFGDYGISYSKIDDLEFNNTTYSGIKMTYATDVGDSPNDSYFMYYDKETYQMKWLGYTVTYGKDKPGTKINFIKYSQWESINGLLLPRKLEWYNTKNNLPFKFKHSVRFDSISILEKNLPYSIFLKPKDAIIGVN